MKRTSRQHVADSRQGKKNAPSTTDCIGPTAKGRSLSTSYFLLSAETGITLIELLVVVSIVAILAVVLGFGYSGWQGRYNVESQVNQLYSDLVGARVRAMQRGISCIVDFPSPPSTADNTYYQLWDDTNDNAVLDAGDTLASTLSPNPKAAGYKLNWSNGGVPADISLTNAAIVFDRKGLISYYDRSGAVAVGAAPSPVTISFTSTASPDYDCIIISQTIINTGQMSGGVCNAK
jgi:prepilin-type N-terminal cleavage/methylation domain-containing protein